MILDRKFSTLAYEMWVVTLPIECDWPHSEPIRWDHSVSSPLFQLFREIWILSVSFVLIMVNRASPINKKIHFTSSSPSLSDITRKLFRILRSTLPNLLRSFNKRNVCYESSEIQVDALCGCKGYSLQEFLTRLTWFKAEVISNKTKMVILSSREWRTLQRIFEVVALSEANRAAPASSECHWVALPWKDHHFPLD
jgi:hypothetical protein